MIQEDPMILKEELGSIHLEEISKREITKNPLVIMMIMTDTPLDSVGEMIEEKKTLVEDTVTGLDLVQDLQKDIIREMRAIDLKNIEIICS